MMVDALVIYTQVDALGDIYDVIPYGKSFKQGMLFLGFGVRCPGKAAMAI